jgi:hypothetical protein
MPMCNRQRIVFGLYLLVLIAAAELVADLFKLSAWSAFIAMQLPQPDQYLWMAVAGLGGGLLIGGVVGIGKLMSRPVATPPAL